MASNGGLVVELVRTFQREATAAVEIGGEFPGGDVEIVIRHAFGKNPAGKIVVFEDLVDRDL